MKNIRKTRLYKFIRVPYSQPLLLVGRMVDFLVKKTPASRLNKMGTLRHDYDMDVDASRIAYGTLAGKTW